MARIPANVQGYLRHGAILNGSGEWLRGPCPLCGSRTRSPFAVSTKTRSWTCKSCGKGGGLNEFFAAAMSKYQHAFNGDAVIDLERLRGIPRGALRRWGIGWSAVARSWALPGRKNGDVCNIALWRPDKKGMATKGAIAGLSYAWPSENPVADADTVWVCEGEWDAMILDYVLQTVSETRTSVIGIIGATSIPRELITALAGKHVVIAFDADPAGQAGTQKLRDALGGVAEDVGALAWPEGTKEGHDVRDVWLDSGRRADTTWKKLKSFLKDGGRKDGAPHITPAVGGDASAGSTPPPGPTGRGLSRKKIIAGFRKWLHLPDPTVLDVVFGTCFANRLGGAPLWMFLVGPPSCGKTAPVESLFGAPGIMPVDVMTPASLISGSDKKGMGDPSEIPRWFGKVVAMKDFTSVLSLPQAQRDLIFGYLRSASDGLIEKTFGNGVRRRFRGKFGIVAGVTPEIERYGPSQSVVGERFLYYRVRNDLVIAAGTAAIDMVLDVVDERKEDIRKAELAEIARKALDRKITESEWPRINKEIKVLIRQLAQWTAALRGAIPKDKYTRELDYQPQSELGMRIATQLAKLTMGIAVLNRRKQVGLTEFKVAVRVARDSAPSLREAVVRAMWGVKDDMNPVSEVVRMTRLPTETIQRVLDDGFLLRIFRKEKVKGSSVNHWGLTLSLMKLMEPLALFVR